MEQKFSDQLRQILGLDATAGLDAVLDATAQKLFAEQKAVEGEVANVLHETAEDLAVDARQLLAGSEVKSVLHETADVIREVASKVLEMPKKAFGELKQVLFDHNTEELALDAGNGCQCTDCVEARKEAEGAAQ